MTALHPGIVAAIHHSCRNWQHCRIAAATSGSSSSSSRSCSRSWSLSSYCFVTRDRAARHASSASNVNDATPSSSPSSSGGKPSSASSLETPPVSTPPTKRQLALHALQSSIPMIGFGFMDNTIMIHAGHYVDCTLGVTFGLSTLAAAGIGQIFSGVGGVAFGEMLENAFRKAAINLGISDAMTLMKMTHAQCGMRASRIASLMGGIIGMALGCTLGLVNLLFVDEWRKESLTLQKLRALQEGQEFEFEVEVNNDMHPGFTTVVVRGPDVDGVLASITASLASIGCSVMELHAARRGGEAGRRSANDATEGDAKDDDRSGDDGSVMHSLPQSSSSALPHQQTINKIEDTFLIHDRSTHRPIENDDLDFLAKTVLSAAKDPLNSHSLQAQVDELQIENYILADRIAMLESLIEERQIKVVKSTTSTSDAEDALTP